MVGRFYLTPQSEALIRQAQANLRRKLMVARSRRKPVAELLPVALLVGREVLR